MTLPNATLFPQALLPLYIFEPRYRRMLADSLQTHRMFSVAMQKEGKTRETPHLVAGLGLIRVSVDHPDGTSHLILQGLSRVELGQATQHKPYRVHPIRVLQPSVVESVKIDSLVTTVHTLVERRISLGDFPWPFAPAPVEKTASGKPKRSKATPPFSPKEVLDYLQKLPDANQLADLVSCALLPSGNERQLILETVELELRLTRLVQFLKAEIERNKKEQ